MYTTPEQKVQQSIIKYIKSLKDTGYPVMYQRREAGGASYTVGSSDLFLVWGPYHIEIEVKSPTGKLSTMQEKWRDRMINNGTPCIVVDDVEYLKQIINKWFIGNKED